MSELSANSVLPIVSALPEAEKHVLLRELKKMLETTADKKPKKKKDVLDLPHMFLARPENREMLIAKIMNDD